MSHSATEPATARNRAFFARALCYIWAFPGTLLGLPLLGAALLTGGKAALRAGVVEAHGGLLDPLLRRCIPIPGGASAITLGHIVVSRNEAAMAACCRHERIHVRQYERWGPFFVPAYLLTSLILYAAGRDGYRENPFEREAFTSAPEC